MTALPDSYVLKIEKQEKYGSNDFNVVTAVKYIEDYQIIFSLINNTIQKLSKVF